MKTHHLEIIKRLFADWAGEQNFELQALPQAGGYRKYYRLRVNDKKAIGVYSPEKPETEAFLTFTKHFREKGLAVPEILAADLENDCYLLSDMGDVSLFDQLEQRHAGDSLDKSVEAFYQQAIDELLRFQFLGHEGLDYSVCYPIAEFDKQSMLWDLNYFKYYFLKLMKIRFDEAALEADFQSLADYLLKADANHFMYRDFQARNILINDGKLGFIDYQGGRRGPLQYDLASLLFQVKAQLPFEFRQQMLEYYLQGLKKYTQTDDKQFGQYYYGFVLIRLLQVMGAYGFRGYFERRPHFLQSIPYAIENVKWWLKQVKLPVALPELKKCLQQIAESKDFEFEDKKPEGLTVEINSFSFKNGAPLDYSGNGGGFVFDCRALPNPGRYQEYKHLTGLQAPVIEFLENQPAVHEFFDNVKDIVQQSVAEYLQRGFSHLQINFGCTGGQHRSVYFASQLAGYLKNNKDVNVQIKHQQIK